MHLYSIRMGGITEHMSISSPSEPWACMEDDITFIIMTTAKPTSVLSNNRMWAIDVYMCYTVCAVIGTCIHIHVHAAEKEQGKCTCIKSSKAEH